MGNRIIIILIIMENYNLVLIDKSYAIDADIMPETGIFVALSSYVADFFCLVTIRPAFPAYNSIIHPILRTFLK